MSIMIKIYITSMNNFYNFIVTIFTSECKEYSRGVVEEVGFIPLIPDPEQLSVSAAKCDYTGVELIVGGENANQGEFPHMVRF